MILFEKNSNHIFQLVISSFYLIFCMNMYKNANEFKRNTCKIDSNTHLTNLCIILVITLAGKIYVQCKYYFSFRIYYGINTYFIICYSFWTFYNLNRKMTAGKSCSTSYYSLNLLNYEAAIILGIYPCGMFIGCCIIFTCFLPLIL